MYGDQSGEFVCGYWDNRGYVAQKPCELIFSIVV